MSEDFILPALGESVSECVITRWLKEVGDRVEVDEPLVEVSTDKVDTELPSTLTGILEEILVQRDETAKPGQILARIAVDKDETKSDFDHGVKQSDVITGDSAGNLLGDTRPIEDTEWPVTQHAAESKPDLSAKADHIEDEGDKQGNLPTAHNAEIPYATPIVRQLARKLNIDLTNIVGSGAGNRILREDVLLASNRTTNTSTECAQNIPSSPEHDKSAASFDSEVSELRGTRIKMSRLRNIIAERAVYSMQNTAQLSTVIEVDLTRIVDYRNSIKEKFKETEGVNLTVLPFIIKATVQALRKYPVINSHIVDDQIVFPDYENISLAVDTERGLLTPVIKNAGDMTVAQFAKSVFDLARRARNNKLSPDELTGGTFTVTNTGSRGALFDTPVVFLPQLAILGIGAIARRPVIVLDAQGNECISIRSVAFFALSYDHRVIDGADAARFLGYIKSLLETGNCTV